MSCKFDWNQRRVRVTVNESRSRSRFIEFSRQPPPLLIEGICNFSFSNSMFNIIISRHSSLPSRWHWEAHSDGLPMIIKWKWQYSFPFRSPRKENLIRGGIAEIPNWLWMTDPKLLICELFRVGWDGSHGLRNYVPWGLGNRLSYRGGGVRTAPKPKVM